MRTKALGVPDSFLRLKKLVDGSSPADEAIHKDGVSCNRKEGQSVALFYYLHSTTRQRAQHTCNLSSATLCSIDTQMNFMHQTECERRDGAHLTVLQVGLLCPCEAQRVDEGVREHSERADSLRQVAMLEGRVMIRDEEIGMDASCPRHTRDRLACG